MTTVVTASAADEHDATERRVNRRAGYEVGLKAGAGRYFSSPMMENLALELLLLRIVVDQLNFVISGLEDQVIWFRDGYEAARDALNARGRVA